MKRIVIAVHGLGNMPAKVVLRTWWKLAIREGLESIDADRRRFPFRLVYWADINHQAPEGSWEKLKRMPGLWFQRRDRNRGSAADTGRPMRKRLFRFLDARLDSVFLGERLQRKFEPITNALVRRFFADLGLYYSSTTRRSGGILVRDAVQERLYRTLRRYRKYEILLIAHSMGSIIAFDVLNRYESEFGIHTLVTMGSPLGLPMVKSRIFDDQHHDEPERTEPHAPHGIREKWINLSHPEDEVAMDASLADDYGANRHGVKADDRRTGNTYNVEGRRRPHDSFGYLSSPETAAVIEGFLSGLGRDSEEKHRPEMLGS